ARGRSGEAGSGVPSADPSGAGRLKRESLPSKCALLIAAFAILSLGQVVPGTAALSGQPIVELPQDKSAQDKAKLRDKQFIIEGAGLLAPTCGTAYCHGAGGCGGGAPTLLEGGLDPDYISKTIPNGVPGTPMIPFKRQYSEDRIGKIPAYLFSEKTAPP